MTKKKALIIGSGPIIIGQACEFDYSGTQACKALRNLGYEIVLVNSNPATIMTDTQIADKVYMEPLTLEYIAKILRYERPDAILPGIGGQTGLNMAMQILGKDMFCPDAKTAIGALPLYISNEAIDKLQPMNANFGILPPPSEMTRDKVLKKKRQAQESLNKVEEFIKEMNIC